MHELTPDWYIPRKDLAKIDNITSIIGTGINNIKTITNFLNDKEIEEALNYINEYDVNYDATHSYPIAALPNYVHTDPLIKFSSTMSEKFRSTAELLYGPKLIIDQGFQLIVHPTGTYIDPHTDIIDIDDPDYVNDTYEQQLEQFPYLWSGHLSILGYLNDDYEGGELYFPELEYAIRPKKGMLIMFPGNLHYVHGVAPITKGVRYTLSQWARFKDFKMK